MQEGKGRNATQWAAEMAGSTAGSVETSPGAAAGRLRSLDAMRGLAITAMIFVNVPGALVWPQLQHAAWNGLTVADLVFPAFLVAVGGSLAVGRRPRWVRVGRRVVVLIALGLVVNRASFTGPLRYPGVLQRIAVCYLIASIVVRLPRVFVVGVAVFLLAQYGAVLRVGGMSATRSFGGRVDIAVFGQRHIYHGYRYDPEGLIGSVAAAASVLIGYLVMDWIRGQPRALRTAGLVAAFAGAVAALGWLVNVVQPVNKRMWTPSYTLVTAGAALIAFALFYITVDVARLRWLGLPFEVIGANAIVVYVASELGDAGLHRIKTLAAPCTHLPCRVLDGHDWIYQHWFAPWAGARPGSLLFSAAFIGVLWIVAALLWRAKLFVRV